MLKYIPIAIVSLFLMAFKPGDEVTFTLACHDKEATLSILEASTPEEDTMAITTLLRFGLCKNIPPTRGVITEILKSNKFSMIVEVANPSDLTQRIFSIAEPPKGRDI